MSAHASTPDPAPHGPAADGAARDGTEAYADVLRWLFAQRRQAQRDPARTRVLLDRLGIPLDMKAVHVTGTTGKGTVAAMIDRGLREDGVFTGRFTSPHVEDFRERIAVDGRLVDATDVAAFVDRVRRAGVSPAPAFFEIVYAMALDLFVRRGVTVAVVEAGVGVRYDATATLEGVVLSVVTNVAMDHAATLGSTIAAIAHDKAHAVRPRTPVVTGATGVARAIVAGRAHRLQAPLVADPPGGAPFAVPASLEARGDVARARNQRLAAAALRLLGASESAVAAGVSAPGLPGRLERFAIEGRSVILDAAHNPDAAAALAASLDGPYTLVFGALGRKDGVRTLRELEGRAAHVVLTEAAPGEGFPAGADRHTAIADPSEALTRALAATPEGGTVVIAGSMYLAGRLRASLRHASGAGDTAELRG